MARAQLILTETQLKKELYAGIYPFDVPWTCSTESFVSRAEFLGIVERCELRGWGVHGLEVFSRSGKLLDVAFSPKPKDRGVTWCRSVLDLYQEPDNLFSATFFLSDAADDPQTSDSVDATLVDFEEALEYFLSDDGISCAKP